MSIRLPFKRRKSTVSELELFNAALARGSAVVTGARAASIQASILSGPLGAGDMHVPVNI